MYSRATRIRFALRIAILLVSIVVALSLASCGDDAPADQDLSSDTVSDAASDAVGDADPSDTGEADTLADAVEDAIADTLPDAGDTTAPTASVEPASASTLTSDQALVVTFDEAMDTSTLALGGSLAAESDGGVWSTVTADNDQLTITPTTFWSAGAHTLTLDAADLAGNALATLTVDYTVDPGAVSVAVTPTDGAVLAGDATIVAVFNRSMDTSTLVLGSDLAAEADGGSWSQTTVADDTLTIAPASAWTEGTARGLTIDATTVDGAVADQVVLAYDVDTTPPTITLHAETVLDVNGVFRICYSEAIDESSITVAGDMAGEVGTITVTEPTPGSYCVQLEPATSWPESSGTLTVDVDDLAGNAAPTEAWTAGFLNGAIFVHPSGTATNLGTMDAPLDDPVAAADLGRHVYGSSRANEIRVAAGTYSVAATVDLTPNTALLGGFDPADWSVRNPASFATVIADTRTNGGQQASPVATVAMNAATLDGVTIQGPTGPSYSAAVRVTNQGSIIDCTIQGGGGGLDSYGVYANAAGGSVATPFVFEVLDSTVDGGSASRTYAVRDVLSGAQAERHFRGNTLTGGTPTIRSAGISVDISSGGYVGDISDNSITGTTGIDFGANRGTTTFHSGALTVVSNTVIALSQALSLENMGAEVHNNLLVAGPDPAGATIGVSVGGKNGGAAADQPKLRNNTIIVRSDYGAIGLNLRMGGVIIEHNILFVSGVTLEQGMVETGMFPTVSDPMVLAYNDIFAATPYVDADNGCTGNGDGDSRNDTCTAAEMAALSDISGGNTGNVTVDPNLDTSTYSPTTSTPCSVAAGADHTTVSAYGFSDDLEGTTRTSDGSTAFWSLGAIEYDGACQ